MATGFSADAELTGADSSDLSELGRLYDEHHVAVHAFARRIVGDEAAWDLVHDTFLTLPKVLPRWSGGSSLRTFIIGIAVNHARHHVRSSARRRHAMAKFAAEPDRAAESPERDAEQQKLAQMLLRALDSLSFEHRSVFVLCEVEERPSAEVANILAIPEGTVRTRLFHARQKLRTALEKQGLR